MEPIKIVVDTSKLKDTEAVLQGLDNQLREFPELALLAEHAHVAINVLLSRLKETAISITSAQQSRYGSPQDIIELDLQES